MKIIAHRGYSLKHNENTWQAIISAFEAGADGCELDVHLTRDNKLFFHHDYYIHGRRIRELSFSEALSLRPDSPDLDNLLQYVKISGKFLIIELKDRELVEHIPDYLKEEFFGVAKVASFDAIALREINQKIPEVETILILGSVFSKEDVLFLAKNYKASAIIPAWEARHPYPDRLIDATFVEYLLSEGIKTILWHEERPEILKGLLRLPVYGICTNDPLIVKQLIQEAQKYERSNRGIE